MENLIGPVDDFDREIALILNMLGGFYELSNFGPRAELVEEIEKMQASETSLVDYYVDMLYEEQTGLFQGADSVDSIGHTIRLMTIFACLAHCVEARREGVSLIDKGTHVCWAHNYLGQCRGILAGEVIGERLAIKKRAMKGAAGRHKETHAIKQQALTWLAQNIGGFKSNPAAADAVRKVVPIAHSTALEYVKEFKKKMLQGE